MKYMLLIYGKEEGWTEQEREDCMAKSMAICQELAREGKLDAASPLHPVSTATSIRIRDGRRQITDGPFAETAEQLGGYYVLDVDNLDEAIAIASRLPPAHKGTVEIRPIFPLPGRHDTELEVFRRELRIAAPAAVVYGALTTQEGIEGWWTTNCTVSGGVGGAVMVRFDESFKVFRIEKLTPSAEVRWRCIDARLQVPGHPMRPDEWVETTINYSLKEEGPGTTLLTVEHIGLGPQLDCYELCCAGWRDFLLSLKQLCETGTGSPFGAAVLAANSK